MVWSGTATSGDGAMSRRRLSTHLMAETTNFAWPKPGTDQVNKSSDVIYKCIEIINRLDDAEHRAAAAERLASIFRLAQEHLAQQGRSDQPKASDA